MIVDHHRLKKVLNPITAAGSNVVLFLEQIDNILGACYVNIDLVCAFFPLPIRRESETVCIHVKQTAIFTDGFASELC